MTVIDIARSNPLTGYRGQLIPEHELITFTIIAKPGAVTVLIIASDAKIGVKNTAKKINAKIKVKAPFNGVTFKNSMTFIIIIGYLGV